MKYETAAQHNAQLTGQIDTMLGSETLTPQGHVNEETGLATRLFTKKQAELAQKIANDIAEDIDCGEAKSTLRMAIHYWSCVATDEANKRVSRESAQLLSALKALESSGKKHGRSR